MYPGCRYRRRGTTKNENRVIEQSSPQGAGARSLARDNCICTRIADAMLDYCASLFRLSVLLDLFLDFYSTWARVCCYKQSFLLSNKGRENNIIGSKVFCSVFNILPTNPTIVLVQNKSRNIPILASPI